MERIYLTAGSSYATFLRQACFKVGNRICISFVLQTNTIEINTTTPLAIIPEPYRPNSNLDDVYGLLISTYGLGFGIGSIYIGSQGEFTHGVILQRYTGALPVGSFLWIMFEYYI